MFSILENNSYKKDNKKIHQQGCIGGFTENSIREG